MRTLYLRERDEQWPDMLLELCDELGGAVGPEPLVEDQRGGGAAAKQGRGEARSRDELNQLHVLDGQARARAALIASPSGRNKKGCRRCRLGRKVVQMAGGA